MTVEPFLKQKLDIESIENFDNISTDPVVVVANQGTQVFKVNREGTCNVEQKLGLPRGERIKYISPKTRNDIFCHLKMREENCDYYTYYEDYTNFVLTESGRLFLCYFHD